MPNNKLLIGIALVLYIVAVVLVVLVDPFDIKPIIGCIGAGLAFEAAAKLIQLLSWFERASCLDLDPDLFFDCVPERAKKICKGCEVRIECLTEALQQDTDGVFGGTTRDERRRLKSMLSAIQLSQGGVVDIPIQSTGQDFHNSNHNACKTKLDRQLFFSTPLPVGAFSSAPVEQRLELLNV